MGVVANIKGDFSNVDTEYLKSYLKSVVSESVEGHISRVVEHGVVKQSEEDMKRELLKMQMGR